jgi:hypothetical protein
LCTAQIESKNLAKHICLVILVENPMAWYDGKRVDFHVLGITVWVLEMPCKLSSLHLCSLKMKPPPLSLGIYNDKVMRQAKVKPSTNPKDSLLQLPPPFP